MAAMKLGSSGTKNTSRIQRENFIASSQERARVHFMSLRRREPARSSGSATASCTSAGAFIASAVHGAVASTSISRFVPHPQPVGSSYKACTAQRSR